MRQDVYRVAYDEAHAELLEISKRFEELGRRKETLQSVVTALGPMLGVVPAVQAAPSAPVGGELESPSLQPAGDPASYSFNQASSPLPEGDEAITDPFQRRVRNALKFGSNNNGHEQRGLQPAV